MKKRFVLSIIIFTLGLVVLLQGFGVGDSSEDKVDEKILERFNSGQETVRVIVNLKDTIEITERKGFLRSSVKEIGVDKNEVMDNVGAENILHEFEDTDSFSAKLSLEEIEKLSEEVSVKKIYYDRPIKSFLQDSVSLTNTTSVWDLQIGDLNLTGEGQTVCILDSGVDYTHPDLGGCTTEEFLEGNCSKVIGGHDFVNDDADPLDDHNNVLTGNSHGTHVSGIVAANNNLRGMAPNSKIVSIKVLDSTGSGSTSDIVAGILWCVSNASEFNISVISLSLGAPCYDEEDEWTGWCYSDYCNEDDEATTSAINNAYAENISVVIATGNEYNVSYISSPSCIQNAIRVGSSEKTPEEISSFSNRWILDMLFAPGNPINSTIRQAFGSYGVKGGTSMATPHVSGAIAIINQYLRATNRTMTPKQVEVVLNSTAKNISADERNYSRIDVYSAIISLDNFNPEISLVSPSNDDISVNLNQSFTCEASDLSLKNITFYLWNSSEELINESSSEISGGEDSFEINISNLEVGSYSWNCLAYDENNNFAFAEENFSLRIGNLPVWCALHFGHTVFSDEEMSHEEQTANILEYYNCGATSDHDHTLNQTEWNLSIETANSNNIDNNFTYFFGTEWSGSQHIFYISLDPSLNLKTEDDLDFNTPAKLASWLSQNRGVGIYAHPARSFTYTNFSDPTKYNETWIPLIDMTNNNGGTYYYHWNYYWNCSEGSGCETYLNPTLSGTLQSASGTGWVKYALDRGIHLGFSCSNDWHGAYPLDPKCYTGLASPPNWTREGVYETLLNRNTWAAEDKITMSLRVNNGSSNYIMGDVINYHSSNSNLEFFYEVNASEGKNISNISVFYNGVIVNVSYFEGQQNVTGSFTKEFEEDRESYLFIEAIQSDGRRAWTSPIWVYHTQPVEEIRVVSPSGGGGGGGGLTNQIFSPSETELAFGFNKELSKKDKVNFFLNSRNHTLSLLEVGEENVKIEIRSEPVVLILEENKEEKVNLSSPDYYELLVKVESISNTKVNLTIKKIYEEIIKKEEDKKIVSFEEEKELKEKAKPSDYFLKAVTYYLLGVVIVFLVIIILSRAHRSFTKKKTRRNKGFLYRAVLLFL